MFNLPIKCNNHCFCRLLGYALRKPLSPHLYHVPISHGNLSNVSNANSYKASTKYTLAINLSHHTVTLQKGFATKPSTQKHCNAATVSNNSKGIDIVQIIQKLLTVIETIPSKVYPGPRKKPFHPLLTEINTKQFNKPIQNNLKFPHKK